MFFPIHKLRSLMWGFGPLLLGENLCDCSYPPVCWLPARGMALDSTVILLLLPTSWFLIPIFSYRRYFLLKSFSSIVALKIVVNLVCLWKQVVQGPPTLSSWTQTLSSAISMSYTFSFVLLLLLIFC